jgi:flagellum-specific peptidoglycan hydrolase FlgJ
MEMGKANFNNSYWGTSRYFGDEYSAPKKECSFDLLRKGIIVSFLMFCFTSCGSRKLVTQNNSKISIKKEVVKNTNKKDISRDKKYLTNREKIDNYIEKFGPVAQDEMKSFGIPASITLAQGILESGMGFGRLAVEGNNHFGIKCHSDWTGKRIYHDDDRKGECFRVYKDPVTSYRDHSLFLKKRSRYSLLFEIKTSNYKAWARGLKKAGYATDPKYPDKLISLIERFDLTLYDTKKSDPLILDELQNTAKISQTHTVQKEDTLYSVSRQYGVSIEQLIKINQISNKTIYLGQELKISTKN